MADLSVLPPEIIREVLCYLPIHSLLEFGMTSKYNHAVQMCSLSSLRLGIFHSRLGGMVSLMEATADRSCLHSVQMILSKHDSRTKDKVICNQNLKIQTVVDAYRASLRDLEVALWELQESSAISIAQLKNLKRLSIRLDHPHTRYSGIDAQFWNSSPHSKIWNILASKQGETTALGSLQSLNLERAGITDYQLAKILESNSSLTEVRLRKCFNLTNKSFKMLADSKIGGLIETLHVTHNDEIDETALPNLKSLSLDGCSSIDAGVIESLNKERWHIPDLTLPSTPDNAKGGVEIDDEYK